VGGWVAQVQSPFGPFKLVTDVNGTALKCPITGSTLKNRYSDKVSSYAMDKSVKNRLKHSKKFHTRGEVNILIDCIRMTNKVGGNTNEARVGTFKVRGVRH
jgi:hypothetical protein